MKQKWILPTAAALCVFAIIGMAAALMLGNNKTEETAFIPPPFEKSAISGTPQVSEDLGYSELDAQNYTLSICGNLIEKNSTVEVYLTNPAENNVWLKLRIADENDNILGESGLLRPGEYVRSVVVNNVPSGGKVKLKVMAYEPETYYSAGAVTLNATILAEAVS